MPVTSNFSFSHSVFYWFGELSANFIKFEIVVCKLFGEGLRKYFLLYLLQMCDFLESEYLEEQVNAIKEVGDHITNLKRVGPGLGEWQYDQKLSSSE